MKVNEGERERERDLTFNCFTIFHTYITRVEQHDLHTCKSSNPAVRICVLLMVLEFVSAVWQVILGKGRALSIKGAWASDS